MTIRLWPIVVEGVWELWLDMLSSLKNDFVISLSNPHWESSEKEQTVLISGKNMSLKDVRRGNVKRKKVFSCSLSEIFLQRLIGLGHCKYIGDKSPQAVLFYGGDKETYLPHRIISMWGSSHYTYLIDWFSSPCPGIVLGFSGRAKQPSLVILSFILWIKLVDWELGCHLKTNMEISYQPKQPNEPISHLFNEIFLWHVHSIVVLSAHLTAVHASQTLQIVILFSIHIKAEYGHGRKEGFSLFVEDAGCGVISTKQLILDELLENVF